MKTKDIIKEIEKLPFHKRIFILEKTILSIRHQEDKAQMKKAAEALLDEYTNNSELTEFTNLDFEDFYETR